MYTDNTEVANISRWLNAVRNYGPITLCAIAGFLSAFTVSMVGLLPVGELVLALVFPWVLVRSIAYHGWPARLQQLGWYKLLFVLIGVMAMGYIGSDLYRGTGSGNLIRGWARVGFLAIDFVTIAYLIDSSWRRLFVFVFALYLGNSLNALLAGPLMGEWWKFGVGYTLTAIGLFAVAGRNPFLQVTVALILGLLSLGLGARSLGSICLLAAGLFWLRYARGVLRPLAFVVMLGALAGMFTAANTVFIENQDHAGSNMERQSMIETAAEAFISSPLVGQGSWFTASRISRLEERMERKDPTFRGYSEEEVRKISIHSQLLVALAEGGVLGGLFFVFLGMLLLKTLRTLVNNPMPHRSFLFYLVIAGLWNLCMSPFSGVTRIEIALVVCACLLVILQQQGELSEDYSE
ncbi:MAG: O-antigen ligase family protein [Verrucomicrobia bacterium]|nr:O-antigen ligase family protein [Verrucomicrobiota bacterium]